MNFSNLNYYEIGAALLFVFILWYILLRFEKKRNINVRDASLTVEQLEEHVRMVALEHNIYLKSNILNRPLIRMNENYNFILQVYKSLNEDVMRQKTVPAAAEWLLDNFYIIEEQVKNIRINLFKKNYFNLPVLKNGPFKGYTRIFALAMELVAHRDGQIEESSLQKYLEAYQFHSILSEREIAVIPTMIKLALIESIRMICENIKKIRKNWEKADEIVEKWISEDCVNSEKIIKLIKSNISDIDEFTPSFLEHLFYKLRRSGHSYSNLLRFVDENLDKFDMTMESTAQIEHNAQAVSNVLIGNCIMSLKYVSALNWDDLFESVSFVDKILRRDPAEIYNFMDLKSRNYYRNQIEKFAKLYKVSEIYAASEAVELARRASLNDDTNIDTENIDKRKAHVGYYIVGNGVNILENTLGKTNYFIRFAHLLQRNLGSIYMFAIGILTILIVKFAVDHVINIQRTDYLSIAVITGIAVFIPASEMAIHILNCLICKIKKSAVFPRLELKEGIPEELSTMVVVPALLTDEKQVEELLENMENHYLSNSEENLYFALIGAFKDSKTENDPDDEKILLKASIGIKDLNLRYSKEEKDIFYFYNRPRKYNKNDNNWIGWERKRGALMELNDMLLGSLSTGFSFYSNLELPSKNIKYIITLDADTILPLGMAKKMIGTMAHPLNVPVIDPEKGIVVEGHGVMQPRISFDMDSSNRSIFSRIYSKQEGIDPYANAVSDVYQDLFCEGIFTGKGIYDLKVFQCILKDALPENAILSHDLLEGSYVRAALVSDLELVDSYPSKFNSYMTRLHRWIRGDWQLIPWLNNKVYHKKYRNIRNPLSFVSIWKIIDNLRRSLVAPAIIFLIFLGFCILPDTYFWVIFAIAALALPYALTILEQVFIAALKSDGIKKNIIGLSELKATLFQFFMAVIFLSYQAIMTLNAIAVTLIRVFITKKNMLVWVTSADAERNQKNSLLNYLSTMGLSMFTGALLVILGYFNKPENFNLSLVFFVLWVLAPFIAFYISKDAVNKEHLETEDLIELRKITRKTWRYFEEFCNAKNNYLAPDNYQEHPHRGIAYRTSPTNIGFGLLACLTARDMGYIGIIETVDRISKTITTIEKMDKWNAHLYNWYDTITLAPLKPKYVSTVDSGNFIGYLITLIEGLKDYYNKPIIDEVFIRGIEDTLRNGLDDDAQLPLEFKYFNAVNKEGKMNVQLWNKALNEFIDGPVVKNIKNQVWKTKIIQMIKMFQKEVEIFTPWASIMENIPKEMFENDFIVKTMQLLAILSKNVSLRELDTFYKNILNAIDELKEELNKIKEKASDKNLVWLNELKQSVIKAEEFSQKFIGQYDQLIERIDELSSKTEFRPLYDERRQLFSIGYNVDENKLSNSYYDLLASEARQTSYIAIARGEIPPKHWFMLGRSLTMIDHYKGLVSWSGTMFEYLMPLLIMKNYKNSLLDETYSFVIKSQKKYGKQRGIPWGASESSFNCLDINLNYQYKAIGIPWLGLKRGLIQDAVTAPYATFLALAVDPFEAYKNIKYLKAEGLEGQYGYYEAADYTPERRNFHSKKTIIKSFMAHHQGMSLAALDNYLNKNIMQKRFSANPYMKSAKLLLQEKVPVNIIFTKENKEKVMPFKETIFNDNCACRRSTALDKFPKAHILSNGNYSVMVTDRGTGYSRNKTIDISRWREDPIIDNYGMFFFIKNIENDQSWSAAYAPLNIFAEKYETVFTPDKALFKRTDGDIETTLEVVVASAENAEIRKISLKNNGETPCTIEITSYFEIVLASHNSDLAHPSFNNLFVETEFDQYYKALLANRRPRNQCDKEIWMAEMLVIDGESIGSIQFETDRMQFIGRGRTINNPIMVQRDRPLSNTSGAVLDPIFSLRVKVKIEPGKTAKIFFVTSMSEDKELLMESIEKYSTIETCDASFWLALTRSQVETKYLNINVQEMELYQDMVSNIIFNNPVRLNYGQVIRQNRKGQSSLWNYGISGDRPIILVMLDKIDEIEILYEVLKAHEYWRLKDLNVDLVILSQEENSYNNPLYTLINEIVYCSQTHDVLNKQGDLFILNTNNMLPDDVNLFCAVARMIFKGGSGTMKEQLECLPVGELPPLQEIEENNYLKAENIFAKGSLPVSSTNEEKELIYFNGLGGFSSDGTEYVITLEEGQMTPAPWINVIANPKFGFMVSEAGGGFSWYENSHENKLTPWSNDPVSDGPGEIFYLRNELGELWSITPLPIREKEDYIITHGFGYTEFKHVSHGISQNLIQFVPVEGTIKISIINLYNESSEDKNLSLTYYLDPVLGVNASDTAMHIISSQSGKGSLFLENPYNRDFADRVCFMDTSIEDRCVTGDRREFFGFGKTDSPEALKRKYLSNTVGAGYDPCAAMQINIDVKANESKEIVFVFGMADNFEKALELGDKFKNLETAKAALIEVKKFWQEKLDVVQVNTPDPAMDIMLNGWLLYQVISCRMWARSAFYQSGGAFGFRDQLQDCLSILEIWPEIAKNQILKHARHQFIKGDVLHWWHEPVDKGIRTRFSDDFLWLPYVTAEYIRVTGDSEILEHEIPFLEDDLLNANEDERYCHPVISKETASLYNHCIRAIDNSLKFGERGLPLMGGGDWNDGMNTVGNQGSGESVWLGWFLYANLQKFIPICRKIGDNEKADYYSETSEKLNVAIEECGWDGNWYKRAFFDNGEELGSAKNSECQIDSIAQSWALISGGGNLERSAKAMKSVEDYLVQWDEGLIKLLTPPFNDSDLEPGYIKGYVPGVRENGAQYTHAAAWVIEAFALLGDGDKAWDLFSLINPINHTRTNIEYSRYKVEPYVMAADVYANQLHLGRGGWTWYTGSASWMYKAGLENILGFNKNGNTLTIDPCIPKKWAEYSIKYKYFDTIYDIHVKNTENLSKGVAAVIMDGKILDGNVITLSNDLMTHYVEIQMGS